MSKANWNRRLNIVFASILSLILIFGAGTWVGYSFTGTTNTFAPGSLETATLNVTGDWYRGATNLTGRLLGTWGALSSTTLDTGQGAYELYGMDQDMLTSSSPTFDDLTSTSLDTGHGANELYDMDQNVLTTSSPTFDDLTANGLTSSWIDLGGDNRTVWPTSAIPSAYEYFIDYNGTYHRVWDGRVGESTVREDLTNVNLDTAIENCLDDDAGRIAIKLGPNCDGTGRTLTIDRSQFSLYTGLNHDDQGTPNTPMISRILFEGDGSTELKNVYIQGLSMQELDFHANEYSIQAMYIDQCHILTDATYKGIIFRDTNTGPGDPFIDWMRFVDLSINDRRDQTIPNSGAISWDCSDDGTGQFWFDRVKYHAALSNNQVFMCFESGRVSPTIWVNNPTFEIHDNNIKLVKIKSGAFLYSLQILNPWMEIKENFTMIEIDNGASRAKIIMDNSVWSFGTYCNVTLIDNGNTAVTDWVLSSHNGLFGEGNIVTMPSTWQGTFEVGTLNMNRRFSFQWSHACRYYNTTSSRFIRMDHAYVSLSSHLLADHFHDGITSVGNLAGNTFYFNDVAYLSSAGTWLDTDADSNATMPVMGMHVEYETVSGYYMRLLLEGFVRDDSWSWATIGAPIYASTSTGEITDIAPSGTGDQVQVLGYVYSTNVIYFDPDYRVTVIP